MKLFEIYSRIDEDGYDDAIMSFTKRFPEEDIEEIKKYVDVFKNSNETIKQLNIPSEHKNIYFWSGKKNNKTFKQFKHFVSGLFRLKSTPDKKNIRGGDQIILIDTSEWLVSIPMDHETSCDLGRNTTWCTAKGNQSDFSRYVFGSNRTLIFCINKNDEDKRYAISYNSNGDAVDTIDADNNTVDSSEFVENGLPTPEELIGMAMEHQSDIEDKRESNRSEDLHTLVYHAIAEERRDPVIERLLYKKQNVFMAFDYCLEFGVKIPLSPSSINSFFNYPDIGSWFRYGGKIPEVYQREPAVIENVERLLLNGTITSNIIPTFLKNNIEFTRKGFNHGRIPYWQLPDVLKNDKEIAKKAIYDFSTQYDQLSPIVQNDVSFSTKAHKDGIVEFSKLPLSVQTSIKNKE